MCGPSGGDAGAAAMTSGRRLAQCGRHFPQLSIECDICHDCFSNISNLTRHKKDKHSDEDIEFKCDWCDCTFKRKDTLLSVDT